MHADIKYENGDFYLFDNNSKFGTLVLLNESLEIKKEMVFLQCGKTVVTLRLKEEKAKSLQIAQDVLETQDSIGTPSTINNDNDVESSNSIAKLENINDAKQQLEEVTIKKRKGRPRKNVKSIAIIDLNRDDISILNIDEENKDNIKVNEIIKKSKKISKLPKKKSMK